MNTDSIMVRLANLIGKERVVEYLKRRSLKTRKAAIRAHRTQMAVEWRVAPEPEWFDHNEDAFCLWPSGGSSSWVERGVFALLAMKQGAKVLELCCGDGFNAKHFYAQRAQSIIAVDYDQSAIDHANRYNAADNVEFRKADIRTEIPDGPFDVIVWDAAIAYFTPDEIDSIMVTIKGRLGSDGILCGHTIRERAGGKQLSHHVYEFKDIADLERFFSPYFKNVRVFETVYSERHNLYFWASDGSVPFDPPDA